MLKVSAHPASISILLTLAWPVILARSAQAVVGFADALMTAPLGAAPLAAVTTGSLNTFTVVIFPMGIAFIIQSFAAQYYGQGDMAAARRYVWYGTVLAVVTGIIGIAIVPAMQPLLAMLPYEEPVRQHMYDYLAIRLLAVGLVVGVEVFGNWYGGLGNTRQHMMASLLIMSINVLLNWLLIEGNLGFPALGVQGAAWASVIATGFGLAFLVGSFAIGHGLPPAMLKRLHEPLRLRLDEFTRMLRFGVPNGVNWFFEFAAFTVFLNVVVPHLGTLTQASVMVVLQINSLSFMPTFGLGSAGAILVGQAIGRREPGHVPAILRRTMMIAVAWQCTMGVLYLAFPGIFVQWFDTPSGNPGEFLALTGLLLAVSAAWQIFDATALTVGETLRAAGDTVWSLWARSIMAWGLFLPVSYTSITILGGGPVTAMLTLVGYLMLLSTALLYRFSSGAWRKIDLTGRSA